MEAKNQTQTPKAKKPVKKKIVKVKKAKPIPSESAGIRMPKMLKARLKREAARMRRNDKKMTFNKLCVIKLSVDSPNPNAGYATGRHALVDEKKPLVSKFGKSNKTSVPKKPKVDPIKQKAADFVKFAADAANSMS